ncbi:MAG: recombinase family protein [Prevotella sp.]|jgi:DNA invertase Pin-like site-specific DNA recombinase|nr:recombinase family protein [Prevotella sp.]
MINKAVKFEIVDYRKSKSQAQWVTIYLSRIRTYFEPIKIFDEIDQPSIEKVYYATNSIIQELIELRSHSRQGISPTIKFDAESKVIRVFNSLSTLVVEIREVEVETKNTIYGYARVSTKKQSLKMQIDELKKFGCIQIVQEKVSALADRPQFDTLLSTLKEGDTLAVWKLDRLGRSMFDLIKIVSEMDAKGVNFVSLTENINTSTSTGKMMLMLFSMMAEYELSIKKERQEATKEIARQSGRLGGRPKGLTKDAKKTANVLIGMYQEKEKDNYKYSISEICTALKISKGTLYKYLAYMNVPKRGNLF